jgi:hypothetical protein
VNSEEILGNSLEHIINTCLQKDETKEVMLKKFNGSKIELVKFLRDRNYKEWVKINKKPADTSDIKNKIRDLKKQHEEDIAEGRLKLYNTVPPPKNKVSDNAPEPEKKQTPKYVEPLTLKKKWAKQKEKPKPNKNQESLF